jgi:hypothetical protein
MENRTRFLKEAVEALISVWGGNEQGYTGFARFHQDLAEAV